MITLESKEFEQLIQKSATFRGRRNFDAAIKLIEDKLPDLQEDCLVNAYLELFNAAKEKGDVELAKQYAQWLAEKEPELPSIQSYL